MRRKPRELKLWERRANRRMRKENNFTVWERKLGRDFGGRWLVVAVAEWWR